jgi:glycerol-3-phosphate acyltransferase PlsY
MAMTLVASASAMTAAAYLVGSVPFGYVLGRFHGLDVRAIGSGNIGATNVGRALGRRWFLICFLLDCSKGFLPVALAGKLLDSGLIADGPPLDWIQSLVWILVGLAAVLGHVFSIFLGFRGGKGAATALGVVMGIYPTFTFAGLGALAIWGGVVLATKYVSLGTLVAALSFPPLVIVTIAVSSTESSASQWPMLACACIFAALIVVRHRSNIDRLRRGQEPRIGEGEASADGAEPVRDN